MAHDHFDPERVREMALKLATTGLGHGQDEFLAALQYAAGSLLRATTTPFTRDRAVKSFCQGVVNIAAGVPASNKVIRS